MKRFLHNRPQNRGVRNPTLSDQVSGYFAEFRQIGVRFPESRPFTEEPAGRRNREPPKFHRISWRYFYTVDRRIVGCEMPTFQPKYVAISLNCARTGGISTNRAPSLQHRPGGGSSGRRIFLGFPEDISTQSTAESWGSEPQSVISSKWRFR